MSHVQQFKGDIMPDNTLGESPEFIVIHFVSPYFEIQWNLSIEDTIGTQLAVLYRKVSLIQRYPALCG